MQIIAFPCNQFGAQEPDSEEDILKFVSQYGVTFPVMGKVDVQGDNADPIYQYLLKETNSVIEWNFAKFLVDANGKPVKFYHHDIDPNDMLPDIKPLLNK